MDVLDDILGSLCLTGGVVIDAELTGDDILWPEGEKDADGLGLRNLPAFTFGGTFGPEPPGPSTI